MPESASSPSLPALNRRGFLGLAGATSVGMLLGSRSAAAESRQPDSRPESAPFRNSGIYRFSIGDLEAFSISDGHGAAPGATSFMSPASQHERMNQALRANYQSTEFFPFNFNVLVVKSPDGILLFDAGYGDKGGPSSGHLVERLAGIGVAPGDVAAIFCSHAHGDHIGGLTRNGKVVFPHASVHLSAPEREFWSGASPDLSGSAVPAEMKQGMIALAQQTFETLGDRLKVIASDQQVFGCVTPVAAYGHTPGHLTYRIASAGETLFHVVDLCHNHVLMFADPTWTIAFDVNPSLAIESRQRIFSQLARERTRVYGYHLPFPALGNIAQRDTSFAWFPENWTWS